jgi:hypothetical protein
MAGLEEHPRKRMPIWPRFQSLVAGWMANRTSSDAVAGPSLSSAFVAYIQSF